MPLDHWKKLVAVPVAAFLKSRGFRKAGLNFSRSEPEVRMLVGLQSSRSSTFEALEITCNVAVFVPLLEPSLKPNVWDGHWRERIGFYLSEPRDHWWMCSSDEAATAAGYEIAMLLESGALPEMERLASHEAMIALWQSGRSPGLTERRCAELLSTLLRAVRSA